MGVIFFVFGMSTRSSDSECSDTSSLAKRAMKAQFSRPIWVEDEEVTRCHLCKIAFGLITRKHHRRACGNIVCKACSPKYMSLTDLGYLDPQRVCKLCAHQKRNK